MSNLSARHAAEFRRATAGYMISTGRPITQCCSKLGLNSRTVGKQVRDRRRGLIATRTFDKEALNELVHAIGSIGVGVVARPFNPFNRQPRTLRPCSVVSLRRSRSILFPANQQRRAFYGVASIRPNGLPNENRPFESLAREDLLEYQRKVVQAPVERERPGKKTSCAASSSFSDTQ